MVGIAKLKYATLDRHDAEGREYTAHYVITDVPATSGSTSILLASGLPQLGQTFSAGGDYDTYAVAVGYAGIQPVNWDASRNAWNASVKYSTLASKQRRPANSTANPIDKPPIISGGGHRRRIAAHLVRVKDTTGRDVFNSAGKFFPDGEIEVDDSSGVLRISRNYATIDLAQLDEFRDSVNVNVWMGKPARTWKMDPAIWRKVYQGNTAYYEISYEFQGNPETWDLKPRDVGTRDFLGNLPEQAGVKTHTIESIVPAGADKGRFVFDVKPAVFNGEGGNAAPFRWYKEKDFTGLGLPAEV